MTNIKWGPEIAVNGKRPEWLRDDELCLPCWKKEGWYPWLEGVRISSVSGWAKVTHIRLPADHPHYSKDDVPDWAKDHADGLAANGQGVPTAEGYRNAFARYIAHHEQPPMDELDRYKDEMKIGWNNEQAIREFLKWQKGQG